MLRFDRKQQNSVKQVSFNKKIKMKKNPPANAGDTGKAALIPGSGRSPGEGNGNPFQYLCLENPMDGGAWWATVHGVAKSRTQLSDFTSLVYTHCHPGEIKSPRRGGPSIFHPNLPHDKSTTSTTQRRT